MHRRDGPQPHGPARASDRVAAELGNAAAADAWDVVEELMGATDCPQGCQVEDDGTCPHGWQSGALSAGLI